MNIKSKINKKVRTVVDSFSKRSKGRIININSLGVGVAKELSNFTRAPFILDGVKYESFEGFWQSLKFLENDPRRDYVRKLYGIKAKKAGSTIQPNCFYYKGKKIEYKSKELYNLAKRAERERFLQNPKQLKALLSTNGAKLIHFVELKDSKSFPRKIFCKILRELREELTDYFEK
jgi:predicted NAD-dependent protein-ADP-ribosyltransferase YbiA (DUF1768 family)